MLNVLDASALLAYLQDEDGADVVADALAASATISAINLAEVFSIAAGRGIAPHELAVQLTDTGLLGGALNVEAFTSEDAIVTAELRPLTRDHGLSLADRACLALARRLDLPAVTSDTEWAKLADDLSVTVTLIR